MRVVAIAVAALCSTPLVAQSVVSASLVANIPSMVFWQLMPGTGGSTSSPAGPLTVDGNIQITGGSATSGLSWTAPSPTFCGCGLSSSQGAGYGSRGCAADWTVSFTGAVGTRGHIRLRMICAGDLVNAGDLRIDIHADGTFEADAMYAPGASGPSTDRERYIPVVLGSTPLPVRILHDVNTMVAQGYHLVIEFVQWSPHAIDLGSSCGVSEVGWITTVFPPQQREYFLAATSVPGSGKDRLIASGHGSTSWFVVSDERRRLPVGALGTQMGCDDVLATALVLTPGVATGSGRWELTFPPLPPGIRLFVQHASLGTAGSAPFVRFGVSNLVQLSY